MKHIVLIILLTLGVWAQESVKNLSKFGGKPIFEKNSRLPEQCEIDGVILSSDGKKLIYSTRDGKMYSQEKDEQKQIFQLSPPFLGSHLMWLDYDTGKNEKIMFINKYKIHIFDLITNNIRVINLGLDRPWKMVLLKKKNQMLVSVERNSMLNTVLLIDLNTLKILHTFNDLPADDIAINKDETKFAVVDFSGSFSYWDLETKQKIAGISKEFGSRYRSVQISLNEDELLFGTERGGEIEVFDIRMGKIIGSYKGHKYSIWQIENISENQFYSTAIPDEIILWDFNKTIPKKIFTEHFVSGAPKAFYIPEKYWIVAIFTNGYTQVWDKNTGALLGGLELLMGGSSTVMTECQMKNKNLGEKNGK